MKTSKKILIGIFASIIIWITAVLSTTTSKVKHLLNENGFEQTVKEANIDKGKTPKLENFTVIVASGKGNVTIEQSENNSFQYFSDKQMLPEIKNDTLFFRADNYDNFIYALNLKTIVLNEKVTAEIYGIKTDTLNIQTLEKTKVIINDLNVKTLNILAKGKSLIELYDLNGNNIETNLVLRDKSEIHIDKSSNLNLQIKKDNEAKLEISN